MHFTRLCFGTNSHVKFFIDEVLGNWLNHLWREITIYWIMVLKSQFFWHFNCLRMGFRGYAIQNFSFKVEKSRFIVLLKMSGANCQKEKNLVAKNILFSVLTTRSYCVYCVKHHSHKIYGYYNGKVCVLLKVRHMIN